MSKQASLLLLNIALYNRNRIDYKKDFWFAQMRRRAIRIIAGDYTL